MTTSSPALVAVASLGFAVDVGCLVVSALKGRLVLVLFCVLVSFSMFGLFGMGLLGPIAPVVGACRIGRPRSWWARRYYGAEKMALSLQRFA